jgi:hypothetical protein
LKLLLDEHCADAIAVQLRAAGHDAMTVSEQYRRRAVARATARSSTKFAGCPDREPIGPPASVGGSGGRRRSLARASPRRAACDP